MPQLNTYQIFLIIVSVLSAVAGATAQLNDLFGAQTAHTIVSCASLLTTLITAIMTPLVGNAGMVKTVAALPGITRVAVNTNAAPAVAAMAVSADQPKVGPEEPAMRPKLQEIAKG